VVPRSYYGAAKGAVELMLHALCEQAGHRVTVLRPSNVYGPGQPALPGFGVIPALMRCARDGVAFECWGSGAIARDFLYIDDFTELVQKVLATDTRGNRFQLLNAGSGTLVSLDELHALISRVSGREIAWHIREARVVDPPQVLLDSSLAREVIGWTPRTDIEQGLRLTWESWMPPK
jgi:UDP-glucose 4-epimerase